MLQKLPTKPENKSAFSILIYHFWFVCNFPSHLMNEKFKPYWKELAAGVAWNFLPKNLIIFARCIIMQTFSPSYNCQNNSWDLFTLTHGTQRYTVKVHFRKLPGETISELKIWECLCKHFQLINTANLKFLSQLKCSDDGVCWVETSILRRMLKEPGRENNSQ